MHQGIGQGLDQVLVEIRLLPDHDQFDVFLEGPGQIAHHPGEATEHLLDGLHAGLHDRPLQIRRHHVQVGHRLGHLLVVAGDAEAHQAVAHQHQLTHHVHDDVQGLGIHPHRGVVLHRIAALGGSRLLGRSGCRGRFGRCWGWLGGRWADRDRRAGLDRDRCRRSRRRHAVLGRLATAVQLIEQAFELVIVDERVHLLLDRLQWGEIRRSTVLTLAVQLVEQRLELVVRDVAGAAQHRRGGDRRRLAGTVQFVQQALEFIGGNFIDGATAIHGGGDAGGYAHRLGGRRRDYGRSGDGAQLLLPFGFAQLVQVVQEIGRGRAGRLPVLYLGKHDVDGIQRL
ncbi:hypothetical protein D3C79_712490 [compost metagenome]